MSVGLPVLNLNLGLGLFDLLVVALVRDLGVVLLLKGLLVEELLLLLELELVLLLLLDDWLLDSGQFASTAGDLSASCA